MEWLDTHELEQEGDAPEPDLSTEDVPDGEETGVDQPISSQSSATFVSLFLHLRIHGLLIQMLVRTAKWSETG
jgi:hypothetical protein